MKKVPGGAAQDFFHSGRNYPEIVIGFDPITLRAWLDWQQSGFIRRSGTYRMYVPGEYLGGRLDAVREWAALPVLPG